MNYIIIEAQTTNNTTSIVTPIPTYSDAVQAEADFLMKASYARLSGLQCHSVTLMKQTGEIVARKAFEVTV